MSRSLTAIVDALIVAGIRGQDQVPATLALTRYLGGISNLSADTKQAIRELNVAAAGVTGPIDWDCRPVGIGALVMAEYALYGSLGYAVPRDNKWPDMVAATNQENAS
jgi:hypothetical protein